jgi:tetratricopeptide (TPR) repeat protein
MARYDSVALSDDVGTEAVESEMERILSSEKFTRSTKLRSLLRFTVTQTLQGNAGILKEYVIGTEVLDKPASYDPRSDSLVRVLASRLRTRLRQYYSNGGSADPLVIDFPKGGYVPIFQRRERFQTETEKKMLTRNLVSRGKFLAAKLTKEALSQCVEDFKASIDADPSWPAAHEGLANVHVLQAILGFERPREVWPLAKAATETSLQLDDLDSEAHVYLGLVQAFYEWNWKDAELHFAKAIARDSYSGIAHVWNALGYLIPTGRLQEANDEIRRSRELAPAMFLDEAYVLALYLLGRYDSVLEFSGPTAQGEWPNLWQSWVRSLALTALGQFAAAATLLEQLMETNPSDARVASMLAYVHAVAGNREKALELCTQLEGIKREQEAWVSNYDLALVKAALGNQSEGLSLLQESLKQREPWTLYLQVDPRLSSLRTAHQFMYLARRIVPDGV